MIIITMIIVKESVFKFSIYATTVYHQSQCDIIDFSWLESWCDLGRVQGYKHMFSSDWSDSNAHFTCLR